MSIATPAAYRASAETSRVANTIREQLGVFGLGVVGARNLAFTRSDHGPALSFQATLHFTDQTRPRRMRVTIALTPADVYTVVVTRPDCTEHVYAENVYAEDLTRLMYALDAHGIPATDA